MERSLSVSTVISGSVKLASARRQYMSPYTEFDLRLRLRVIGQPERIVLHPVLFFNPMKAVTRLDSRCSERCDSNRRVISYGDYMSTLTEAPARPLESPPEPKYRQGIATPFVPAGGLQETRTTFATPAPFVPAGGLQETRTTIATPAPFVPAGGLQETRTTIATPAPVVPAGGLQETRTTFATPAPFVPTPGGLQETRTTIATPAPFVPTPGGLQETRTTIAYPDAPRPFVLPGGLQERTTIAYPDAPRTIVPAAGIQERTTIGYPDAPFLPGRMPETTTIADPDAPIVPGRMPETTTTIAYPEAALVPGGLQETTTTIAYPKGVPGGAQEPTAYQVAPLVPVDPYMENVTYTIDPCIQENVRVNPSVPERNSTQEIRYPPRVLSHEEYQLQLSMLDSNAQVDLQLPRLLAEPVARLPLRDSGPWTAAPSPLWSAAVQPARGQTPSPVILPGTVATP